MRFKKHKLTQKFTVERIEKLQKQEELAYNSYLYTKDKKHLKAASDYHKEITKLKFSLTY